MLKSEIDHNKTREYIVTVKEGVDWRVLHNELIQDTTTDDSVDSNIVPDRECHCCKERAINPRNTHYDLTENEAIKLRNDPRVIGVMAVEDKPEPTPYAVQDGNFNRTTTDAGTHDNWGLLRHINQTNSFNNSSSDPGGAYNYVLDGTGVDVIILDTGIQVGHPEWEDANGVSRLKQVDWPTISGINFTQPANFYTDINGHGTHCAGTMAGKNFGWAKNADLYNITLYSNSGNNISWENAVDAMIGWHTKKNNPSDPAYTGRPTVVNMSFGYSRYIWSGTPNQYSFSFGGTRYDIVGGTYQGTGHSDTTNLTGKGLPAFNNAGYAGIEGKFVSDDADVRSLINAGIHVCCAAGNSSLKMDVPGGTDYNNNIKILNDANLHYYHRGGSPSAYEGGETIYYTVNDGSGIVNSGTTTDAFNVGSTGVSETFQSSTYKDDKAEYSNSGPGIDIYSAGTNIMSARPNVTLGNGDDKFPTPYFDNSSYRQDKISGTSMATPQIVGMIACLLQAHPDWTPAQVKKYFTSNSLTNMYDTGSTTDYSTTNTIHGSPNRVAYFPMHGDKPFNIG